MEQSQTPIESNKATTTTDRFLTSRLGGCIRTISAAGGGALLVDAVYEASQGNYSMALMRGFVGGVVLGKTLLNIRR